MLARITAFERDVREEGADGVDHVSKRRQQRRWCDHAGRKRELDTES